MPARMSSGDAGNAKPGRMAMARKSPAGFSRHQSRMKDMGGRFKSQESRVQRKRGRGTLNSEHPTLNIEVGEENSYWLFVIRLLRRGCGFFRDLRSTTAIYDLFSFFLYSRLFASIRGSKTLNESALRGRIALPGGIEQDAPATVKMWAGRPLSLKHGRFVCAPLVKSTTGVSCLLRGGGLQPITNNQ
jgi:hypothetical protein